MGLFDRLMNLLNGDIENTNQKANVGIAKKSTAVNEQTKSTPKAPPKPACDKGECIVCEADGLHKRIYFTCDKSVDCPKKAKYPHGEIFDNDYLAVIRAYAKSQKSSDWDTRIKNQRAVATKLIKTYVPQLHSFDFATFIGEKLDALGVDKKNPLVTYIVNLKLRGVDIPTSKKEKFQNIIKTLADTRIHDPNADWLYNPSLYDSESPRYVVHAFLMFTDKKYIEEHLLDASVVDINEFYNQDGTIKTAGSENNPDEDSIYNVIEKWGKDNTNTEVYERERKEREEKERIKIMCNTCAKNSYCELKWTNKNPNCPAFEPKRY